jgi:2-polyprenyl-6-methoxyphenol hydroxylase-like FAD-dependent oxidoreductase
LQGRYDVVVIGAGLAGLSLTRQLLLHTDKTVLLLDKWPQPARRGQKVGESLVQLSGYYFSKVLDLEEHLLRNHYLKYNLRFYWPTAGRSNGNVEDYSQSFIRLGSNIATFQLDRNLLEQYLLELVSSDPRCTFYGGAQSPQVTLGGGEDNHTVAFNGEEVKCGWVIDTSGRGGVLRRMLSLDAESPIRHGATFCWVDGLVNVEKLTDRSQREIRLDPRRQMLGSFPGFLPTTHFCAEGQWFWVITLHGKTSLGLVYDSSVVAHQDVSTGRKLIAYACEKWPLFARDLPRRTILDEGRYVDFAYDTRQAISGERWALSGEGARFSDPLYSPGSDLIAISNTLLVDAIGTRDPELRREKCRLYDQIARVMYEAYVPSYAVSYDCLGDQEAFTLKYSWELATYFGFYVLPFINDLFTDSTFMAAFLRRFARLGPINPNLQQFLSRYYCWKQTQPVRAAAPLLFELYDVAHLRESERLFYRIGLTRAEVLSELDHHLERLLEMARYVYSHVYAAVLRDPNLLRHTELIERLDLAATPFDPDRMCAERAGLMKNSGRYCWSFEPLHAFLPQEGIAAAHPA